MAKKSRVPTPPRSPQTTSPRTVQAPATRKESRGLRSPGDPRRTRIIIATVIGAVAVVAVVVGIVLATGGESASAALSAAGCTEQTFPSKGRAHVATLPKGYKYNSFPPTSGTHDPQWALWNIYPQPVPFVNSVHNLEHGGIVVHYGDKVSPETVQQISDWYAQDPTALLVAPLPALGEQVAFSAWTQLALCPGFDEKAADAFRDQHIFQGPEQFPPNQLQPGQ